MKKSEVVVYYFGFNERMWYIVSTSYRKVVQPGIKTTNLRFSSWSFCSLVHWNGTFAEWCSV